MLKQIKDLAIKANKKYSEEGLRSLSAGGLHYIANAVDGEQGYYQKEGETVFTFPAAKTTVQIHASGLGDLMIVKMFGRALQNYYSEFGDPELGNIVISTGGGGSAYDPDEGDINLYWWYCFGEFDDRPGQFFSHYKNETSVEPDVVLCLSDRCIKEVEQSGYDGLYLPLGYYGFKPLGFNRSGLGYAGQPNHKRSDKESRVLGPVKRSDKFEWVSDFAYVEQLNLWYNKKMITFGLHKEGQRQWGMVNNRVFEALASGTPFILENHPKVNDVLEFEFPYQTDSAEETRQLVEEIKNNPQETISEFRRFSKLAQQKHTYHNRISDLFDYLD